jgi:hypothetical protein
MLITGMILLSGFLSVTSAQPSQPKEVQAVIDQLFEGMLNSDSSMVANSFRGEAIMQTIRNHPDGTVEVVSGSLNDFLTRIQQSEPGQLNEKLGGYDIKIDGELASVWTPYEFYVGDEFSHCGVNSFQLVNTENGWKIFHIVDTRRQTSCKS